MKKKKINHNKAKLVFVDLETTGLNPLIHEIIEIGFLKARPLDFKVLEQGEIKVKPKHIKTADKEALKVNKYNKKDWQDAIPLKKALQIFREKSKGAILVGHNTWVDMAFLEIAFRRKRVKHFHDYHILDTVSLAFQKLRKKKAIKYYSLAELAKYFKIKMGQRHCALSDAKTTFKVFKKLTNL